MKTSVFRPTGAASSALAAFTSVSTTHAYGV
jgi:hypothetical protein